VALSLMATLPKVEATVKLTALVLETSTAPFPPLTVSEPLAPVRLSELAVELTPVAPIRLMDVLALSPLLSVIELLVELRLIFAAEIKLKPASVMAFA